MSLKKQLSFFEAFSLAAGAMVSSGLFVLPSIAYQKAGIGVIFSYLLAGILMLPTIYTQAELSTAMPKAGGSYFYITRILGIPTGVVAGITNWLSIALKSAFALIGIGAFASLINPDISEQNIKLIAAGATVFFTLLNLISTKHSGKLQTVLVIFLLTILALFIIDGYHAIDFTKFRELKNMHIPSILGTTGMVFISFGGLTKIASVAEEIKNPGKNLPKAMLYAFFIINITYILVVTVIVGVLEKETLINTLTPVSAAAKVFAGKTGLIATSIAAILAFITTANAGIMSASRSPLAMSRDNLVPKSLMKINKKFNTPHISILLTGGFIIVMILAFHINELVKVASAFMLLLFILLNISLIVIRKKKIRNYKPTIKAPFFPYSQIFVSIVYVLLIIEMGMKILLLTILFIFISILWYFLYSKKHAPEKEAIINLATTAADDSINKDETMVDFEVELLEILEERDEIVEDQFDKLVKKALILDITEDMDKSMFFKLLAEKLSKELDMSEDEIYKKLCDREKLSSTNIAENISIPHIIIDGENIFSIVIARSKNGIKWEEKKPPVKAVFCLIGTLDERHMHLKALMSIAQMVQNKDFITRFENATDVEDIRTTILLTPRKRESEHEKNI